MSHVFKKRNRHKYKKSTFRSLREINHKMGQNMNTVLVFFFNKANKYMKLKKHINAK